MQVRQILANSIWYGIIPKLTVVINLILLPVITPYLTPFDYGIIGIITAYSGLIGLIAILGLNIHLTNSFYVYGSHFRKVWGRILGLLLLSGFLCAAIYGTILFFALTQITGLMKLIVIICACIPIALTANVTLAQHYYTLIYKPRPLVLRNLAASVGGLLITFVCIYYFRLGYIGWILGTAGAAIIGFMLFISPLWRQERILPNFSISRQRAVKWLKISLPIVPHSLGFVLLTSSSRIIMDWLGVSIDDIGLYSNGYIMGDYSIVISSAMIVAVAPRIQELYRSRNFPNLRRLYIFCQVIAVIVALIMAIWMPQIYQLLIHNEQLQPAAGIAVFICFANAVFPFYSFISTAAFIEEHTKTILWLVFVPATLNIILNLIFISIYGYQAAVFTTLAAYWSQLLIPYLIRYFRTTTIKIFGNLRLPLILLGVLLLAVTGAYFGSRMALMPKIGLTAGIGTACALYLIRQRTF